MFKDDYLTCFEIELAKNRQNVAFDPISNSLKPANEHEVSNTLTTEFSHNNESG